MTITNGDHTSGSQYARTELREIYKPGKSDNWKLSDDNGLHVLNATVSVPSCATQNKKVTIGQIHTVGADIPVILELQWVNGWIQAMYSLKDSSVHKYLDHNFTSVSHQEFNYQVVVNKGTLSIEVDGKSMSANIQGWSPTPQYFKAGDYVQSNVGAYQCTAWFKRLCVTHGLTHC